MREKNVFRTLFTTVGLVLLLTVGCPISLGQRSKRKGNSAPVSTRRTYTSSRQVDFKNFTYQLDGQTLRLRQGKEIIRDGTE